MSFKSIERGVATATGVLVVVAILIAGLAVGMTALNINHFGGDSSTTASSSISDTSSKHNSTTTTSRSTSSSSSLTSSSSRLSNSTSSHGSSSTRENTTTSNSSLSTTIQSSTSTFSLSQETTDSTSSSTSSSFSTSTSSTSFSTVSSGSNYSIGDVSQYPSYAGYQAYPDQPDSSVLSVSASWHVPVANCNKVTNGSNTLSAVWIGIFDFRNIEQIGTESDCFGHSPSYLAWYEFWPAQEYVQTIDSHIVSPGDLMIAQVSYTPTSSDNYTLTIVDQTQGWSKTVSGIGGGNIEPEWIVEAPVNALGEPYSLANFGAVTFSSCSMTILYNGVAITSPITNEDHVYPIEMVNGATGDMLATISNLSNDGTSFMVTWNNSR